MRVTLACAIRCLLYLVCKAVDACDTQEYLSPRDIFSFSVFLIQRDTVSLNYLRALL